MMFRKRCLNYSNIFSFHKNAFRFEKRKKNFQVGISFFLSWKISPSTDENALRARLNLQDEHGYVSKAYMEFIKSIFIITLQL